MARFWQRTKDNFTAPAQYIQTTDSVSRPMAVMLSLVMLFVAIAILFCLFFAGKWAYEQITGKNDKPANPTTGITTTPPSTDSGSSTTSEGSGNTATVTANGTGSAVVTSRPEGTTSTTNNATQGNSSNTTAASNVPNTGTGSMLGIFAVSSVIGTLAYRTVLIRRMK